MKRINTYKGPGWVASSFTTLMEGTEKSIGVNKMILWRK